MGRADIIQKLQLWCEYNMSWDFRTGPDKLSGQRNKQMWLISETHQRQERCVQLLFRHYVRYIQDNKIARLELKDLKPKPLQRYIFRYCFITFCCEALTFRFFRHDCPRNDIFLNKHVGYKMYSNITNAFLDSESRKLLKIFVRYITTMVPQWSTFLTSDIFLSDADDLFLEFSRKSTMRVIVTLECLDVKVCVIDPEEIWPVVPGRP